MAGSKRHRQHDAVAAPSPGAPRLSLAKKLVFSVLTTVTVLATIELVLWLARVEPAYYREDPYAGFATHIPHYVAQRDASGQAVMTVAPNKVRVLNPQQFAAEKPPGAYRIVCLGGSTTYGRPFFDATSFPGWLRALLPAAEPAKNWDVINAGGISYASYRAAGLMEELAHYEPDLFIVYTGHNEFLERRTYGDPAGRWAAAQETFSIVSRTRTATLLRNALDLAGVPRAGSHHRAAVLGDEVRSIPIDTVGPEAYHRDDRLAAEVADHFAATLRRMSRIAADAQAELLLVVPASNLADFAPIKSEHAAGLESAALARWNEHESRARSLAGAGKHDSGLREIDRAAAIDDEHAGLWYLRGQILQALGRHDDAHQALVRARDEDVCPLRATSPLVETVRRIAAEQRLEIVDFEAIARQASENGLPGRAMFHDHVHPTIDANRRLALAIIDRLASRGIVQFGGDWNQAAIERVSSQVERAIDRPRHARELRVLASMLAWLKQPQQARHQAELSLDLSGRTSEALLDLGARLREQGAPALAAEFLQQLLDADPQSAAARCALGLCWLESGREPQGVEELQQALTLNPDLAEAHTRLGLTLAARGELEPAERHFSESVRLLPESHSAHNNLGLVLARRGRLRAAVQHYDRALELAPENGAVHYNAGLALEQLGERSAARAHFEATLRTNPAHKHALSHLRSLGQASGAAR